MTTAIETPGFLTFTISMGRNYLAAVISAGFSGISLGATPTAIANMTAVAKVHGAAPMAFIIFPLVSAFFYRYCKCGRHRPLR
jgi:glutamate:Na+ symporter, ESS family